MSHCPVQSASLGGIPFAKSSLPYCLACKSNVSLPVPVTPTPSSFTVDMDIANPLPMWSKAETPVVHKQDCLSIPSDVVATSKEFSELLLSPRSVCAALKGHSSPSWEELLHITQGLAGVVRKNKEVSHSNHEQLEVLQQ